MPEKEKLYMFQDFNQQFYASTFVGGKSEMAKYFTSQGLSQGMKYYKSLKSLAIAIRNAGYHGVDRTKPD